MTIGPYDAALRRHRVWMSTNEARDAYKRRKPLVEPVFGIIKEQLAARRFLLRGFANVSAEWTLLGTAFNPAHPLASVAPRRLCRTTSRPKASLRFLNRRDSSGHPLVAVPPPAYALQASPCGEHPSWSQHRFWDCDDESWATSARAAAALPLPRSPRPAPPPARAEPGVWPGERASREPETWVCLPIWLSPFRSPPRPLVSARIGPGHRTTRCAGPTRAVVRRWWPSDPPPN